MRFLLSAVLTALLAIAVPGAASSVRATQAPQAAPVRTTPEMVRLASHSIVRIEISGPVKQTVTTGEGPDAKTETLDGYQVFFGTGFVIDDAGHVVTNNHVVHPAGAEWTEDPTLTIELPKDLNPATLPAGVELHNGRFLVTQPPIVGFDEQADLAVLQIPAGVLPALKFAPSDTIEVGEDVVAIGFALGLKGSPTVTKGILSATGRNLTEDGVEAADLIQMDAAINHGNSGGPLLDTAGEVVGINTYTLADPKDPQTQGLYLARSSRTLAPYIAELIHDGEIARPDLGVKTIEVSLAASRSLDLPEGVVITDVEPDSLAEKAGLHSGEMIVRVNGYEVKSLGDLHDALALVQPDEPVAVEYQDYEYTLSRPDDGENFVAKLAWSVLSAAEKDAAPKTVNLVVK